jgi:drug/metabolite transporter (DMT)-like permease
MESGLALSTCSLNLTKIKELDAIDVKEELINNGDIKKIESKPKSIISDRIKGSLYIIIGSFLFCLNSALIKLSFTLNAGDHIFIRFLLQIIIFFIICKYKGLSIFGDKINRKWLIMSAFFSVFVIISNIIAVQLIHVSDLITIGNSSIIITAILCRIFLNEKLTIIHFVAFILTAAGIIFICRPTFLFPIKNDFDFDNNNKTLNYSVNSNMISILPQRYVGVGVVLAGAICIGIITLILKKLANVRTHYAVVNMFPAYFGFPSSLIIILILKLNGVYHVNINEEKKLYPLHIVYSICGALSGILGISLFNIGFMYEDATKISIIKTVDVVFSFLLQFLLLNVKIDMLGVLGAFFVLSATFFIIISKLFENSLKKKCCCKLLVAKF